MSSIHDADHDAQFGKELAVQSAPSDPARWEEDADGVMRPILSRIHTIPLEDRDSLLHCAQMTCWCSPRINPVDPLVILHQALTTARQGWVLIGELDG